MIYDNEYWQRLLQTCLHFNRQENAGIRPALKLIPLSYSYII